MNGWLGCEDNSKARYTWQLMLWIHVVENVYTIHTICSVARRGWHMVDSYVCY